MAASRGRKCSSRRGSNAEYFFVLLEGEISVWKKHAEQGSSYIAARPGAFFGESLWTWHALPAVCTRRMRLPANRFSGGSILEAVGGSARRFRVRFSARWLRVFATSRVQRDSRRKLEALGTMSAGLEVIGVWRIKIPNESPDSLATSKFCFPLQPTEFSDR